MALPLGDNVVTGTLSGVEPRSNGWFRFSVLEEGKQYPVKADTKKPELVQQAMALLGQPVSVMINRQDSGNPNPNSPGTNYINSYLNQIGPAGSIAAGAVPQAQPQQMTPQAQPQAAPAGSQFVPGDGSGENPIKALRIARMAASERAIQMAEAKLLTEDQLTPAGLVEVAEVWVAYYLLGPGRFGVQAFNAPPQPEPEPEEQQEPEQPTIPTNIHPTTGEVLPEGYTTREDGVIIDANGFPADF